jgi:Polyphosphate kinase 2 (PPK2)
VNLTKQLRVEPGSKVKLADIDPSFHGKHGSKEEAKAELESNLGRITELQRKLYASRSHCLLIVLQGIDGAGKDGTCWHVMSAMDPQGGNVVAFKQPTPEERDHDFLWRVHPHAPGLGRVAIFNRSHYEDVLIARVHNLVPKNVWKPRFDFINGWEKLLASEKIQRFSSSSFSSQRRNNLLGSRNASRIPRANGRSARVTIRNASCGTATPRPSKPPFRIVPPTTPRGSWFLQTTNGSGILRSHRLWPTLYRT